MKKIVSIVLSFTLLFTLFGCSNSKYTKFSKSFLNLFDTASSITAYDTSQAEFNKKYNVYVQKGSNADGQVEARYLFNTVFLERFMQLQTSFRVNKMQCSIYGNSMLILLATNKDLFEMNHLFKRIDDIHQYQHLFDEFASVLSFIDVLNLSSRTGL